MSRDSRFCNFTVGSFAEMKIMKPYRIFRLACFAVSAFSCLMVSMSCTDVKRVDGELVETPKVSIRPNRDRAIHIAESKGWYKRNLAPFRCKVSVDKCQEIKSVFDKMALALDVGHTNVLHDLAVRMPACVSNVTEYTYLELRRNFSSSVRKRFLQLQTPLNFDNVEDFRSYLDGNLVAAEILGDFDLLRQDYSSVLRCIDSQVVRQLKRYKSKFDDEHKEDMALYASQWLERWCEKIDSQGGYLHKYMIFQVSLQLLSVKDWQWEELLGAIRHEADGLIEAGYKPKWLDAEFPEAVTQHE